MTAVLDSLDVFWLLSHADNPVLSFDQFRMFPENVRTVLLGLGLLREGQLAQAVECDGCEEGHVEEVFPMNYPDGTRRFFVPCPECLCVEVEPQRLRQWVPNYGKMAEMLSAELDCFGGLTEIIPNRLWSLGQSLLAHRPTPMLLARYVVDDLLPVLSQAKDGVLFVMGANPTTDIGIARERIINIDQIVIFDAGRLYVETLKVQSFLQSLADSNSSLPPYVFRRKGSMWQIRFDSQEDFYLPDLKGAEYIRQLISSPGKSIDVFDVIASSCAQTCMQLMSVREAMDAGLTVSDKGLLNSATEIADWRAIGEYRSELTQLLAAKEKARRDNNNVELAHIERDVAAIVQRINEAVGIGGKLNVFQDKRRNLRDAFSKSVKRVIAEIGKTDAACAEHFTRFISYGNQPIYGPAEPMPWETEFMLS